MSENKFIKRLKGEQTAKSVLEIKNESAKTSFANMPQGTSNAINVYSDHRGNATAVLEGTDVWKLNNSQFVVVPNAFGDGRDFTSTYTVFGSSLWVNATYTFDQPKIFTGATQWTLKLCGHSLLSSLSNTIGFSLIIKFGNAVTITKSFSVSESAFEFCKEFIIDFSESEQTAIKVANGDTMTVQLLCADATASATIYNGMTTLVAQQRRVDGEAVASDLHTFEDLEVEIAEIQDDIVQIHEDIDDLEEYVDDTFVKKAGDTMSGALNIANIASSNTPLLTLTHSNTATYKWNIAPRYNSTTLSIYPGSTETNGFRFATTGFVPASNNARYLGSASLKWKGVYTAMINNGGDLVVPAVSGTLATKADVDLAANSGRMITDQGVWYAKMYSATVAPSAEDGTNYADFSQVDGQGNPIIVIYSRVNGAWVQDQTITPPAEYDGYVPITSKIWDITEQAGQQGGRILWNHQSKEFTPYPQIISFEDIEITGNSTVIMPQTPSTNQIVNKDYVDSAIGNATITITQGGTTVGSFTTNQSSDQAIDLASGGYHPDLFAWEWSDALRNDVQWLRADTFSWQSGEAYEAAYDHLVDDITTTTLLPYVTLNGNNYYRTPSFDEPGQNHPYAYVYNNHFGTIDIKYSDFSTGALSETYWPSATATTDGIVANDGGQDYALSKKYETVGGYTIGYYETADKHKIVDPEDENLVKTIYNAVGVAWYYILDTVNQRFKLPRTKFGFTGLRDNVGNYVEAGAPNITGLAAMGAGLNSGDSCAVTDASGAFYAQTSGTVFNTGAGGYVTRTKNLGFDASRSSSVYGNSDTVQPKATQMYLYFYVGQFTQTALENTAGITAETLNDKVDKGHQVIEFQAPTADNGYTWYRKYADGWVEQGGLYIDNSGSGTIEYNVVFPITMANNTYITNCFTDEINYDNVSPDYPLFCSALTTTGMTLKASWRRANFRYHWEVKGMAA